MKKTFKKKLTLALMVQIMLNYCTVYCQSIYNSPSINHFFSDNRISTEPNGGAYIKATAEHYGIAVSYKLNKGNEVDLKKSILATIAKIKMNFPLAKYFMNNTENSPIEINDSILLNFIHISPYPAENFKFSCLIKLENQKENDAIINFYKLKSIIESIAIPITGETYNNSYFFRYVDEMPIIGFKSLEPYNELVMKKIISEYNTLSSAMVDKQLFEIEISNYIEVTRASLFNCYFFKKYNLKLTSK